ncbi:MAG: PAS domain-containing protein [Deltaproteobacteria bacterium]|nr:PAS domain-containing protein [Deltaproteobacteria bacterium]
MRVVERQENDILYQDITSNSSQHSLESLFSIVAEGKRVWEATFDAIVDPVLIISEDFKIQRANLATAEAAQVRVQDLIGKPCYEIFAKRSHPCSSCPINKSSTNSNHERRRLQPFSDGREYVASSYPIKGKNQKSLGLTVLQYQDVSAIRKLEEQLVQSEKMAAIGLFTSGLAHDINNPIAGILAFAQLAKESISKNSEALNDLTEIENAAHRCKKIVEDLMLLSRPLMDNERQCIDIRLLITETLPSLEVQWKKLDYTLNINLNQLSTVWGNASKLQQVFSNILLNAFQAISAGGKIEINAKEEGDEICVEIIDNGSGIAEQNLKKIFDPYFTTKRDYGGNGLGLPVTYSIIREHGGRIEVESQLGEGTHFKVFIPIGRCSEETHFNCR